MRYLAPRSLPSDAGFTCCTGLYRSLEMGHRYLDSSGSLCQVGHSLSSSPLGRTGPSGAYCRREGRGSRAGPHILEEAMELTGDSGEGGS